MIKGRDQTFARDNNMKAIFSLLAYDNMSCTQLAEKIGLSKPALTKITREMFSLGLISKREGRPDKKENELGRTPVYYTINPNYGFVAVVDFSTVNITIRLSNLAADFLDEEIIYDSEYITFDVLKTVSGKLAALKDRYEKTKGRLCAVCIAASGMISRGGTVEQSPKFTECTGINLRDYFQEALGCEVIVKNDINLSLLGEKNKEYASFTDAVMLYIDAGIGGALTLNSRIVEGENGFAGEFGLMLLPDGGDSVEFDKLASINAIKGEIRKRIEAGGSCSLPERFRFKDVVDAYHAGDALVRDVIAREARFVATFVRNIVATLDCRLFMLSGRIRLLGESFLETVRALIPENLRVKIVYNPLGQEAILTGATTFAIDYSINKIIESR